MKKMYGNNPIRPVIKGDGSVLQVQEIFETVQGEGVAVGTPSVFIRLGGCNLACSFCDTEFESFSDMHVDVVVSTALDFGHKYIVITGGEPLRQPIEVLCSKLVDAGKTVQLETNGLLYRPLPEEVQIVCSPKPTKFGYHKIRPDLLGRITTLKFLVSAHLEWYGDIPDLGQHEYGIETFVQPIDEYDPVKNKKNTDLALALSMQKGYRISLQIHKILGVD
jgi:7-carboxy-7-deazaguanine synthase